MNTLASTRFPTITPEALANLQARLGKPVRRPEPYIEVATRDAIRHWAHGIGDRNPPGRPTASRRRPSCSRWTGSSPATSAGCPASTRCTRAPTCAGSGPSAMDDRVVGDSVLHALIEKPSKFAKRAIQQIYRTTFTNQRGRASSARPTPGASAPSARRRASAASTSREGPHRTPPSELADIAARYATEAIRGADAALLGGRDGRRRDARGRQGPAHRDLGRRLRAGLGQPLRPRATAWPSTCSSAIPRSASPTTSACPSRRSACTGTRPWPARVGVPGAYDYGPERVAWLGHLVTNWMGDAGFLRRLQRPGAAPQPDRRHHVVPRPRASARRPAAWSS